MKFLNYIFVLLLISAELSAQIYIGSRGNVGGAPQLLVSGRVVQSDGDGTVSDSAVAVSDVARLSVANTFTATQSITVNTGGATGMNLSNIATATTSSSRIRLANLVSGGTNSGVSLEALGTAFTTAGAKRQDGAFLHSESDLSGGLSIASSAGDMRFYNGGTADANLVALWTGSSLCLGPENAACSGTLEIQNAVATTGSTNVSIVEGAGQSGNSFQIFASDGTTNRFSVSSAGAISVASNVDSSGARIQISATGRFEWSSRSRITSSANGNIGLSDAAGTSFGLLQGGGTTDAFPALKRFGNAWAHRAADDTVPVFSELTACAAGGEGATTPVSDSSTATWGATITGGGANRVLAYCNGTNWTVSGI